MELRLPSEYQEVEYIENTGTQYIITDLLFSKELENPKIEWGFMQIAVPSGDNMIFGYWTNGSIYYEVYNSTALSYASIGKNHYDRISNANLTKDMFIAGVMTKETMYLNGYSYATNAEDTIDQSVRPMAIFAWNSSSGRTYTNKGARIYYLRFFDGNTKMADYVPCYRKSDGEIGMYDTVTKTFYTNSGADTFLKGADITRYIDNVSVLDTRRRILLNTPHIDTSVGDLVTFNTDLSAPLKSCKVSFLPVQEGEGDPSPENVREITGWNGVEGYKCGKNMAHIFGYGTQNITDTDVNKYKTTNSYGTTINTTIFQNPDTPLVIEQSQAPNSTTPNHFHNGYIVIGTDNLIFGQKYNVSFKVSNITNNILNISLNNIRLLVPTGTSTGPTEIIDDVLIFKNITFYQNTATPKRQGFEIRICGLSFTLSEFMVTAVDNEDFTYEPYQGTKISTDWTEDIGTVYGGYVDLVSGELVQEFKQCKINELSWTYFSNGACFAISKNTPNDILKDKSLLISYIRSNYYTPIDGYGSMSTYADKQDYSISLYAPSDQHRIVIKDSRFTDVSSFLSAMGDTYIWYRLAEPTVTYQLTPQQLTTLRGINNIWSSANGEVEIKYWKH